MGEAVYCESKAKTARGYGMKYPCIFHADRREWVKVKREFQNGERIEGCVCYECYQEILKRDKLENGKVNYAEVYREA